MERTLIVPVPEEYPEQFRELLTGADVYDSSCSDAARVVYIDRDGGLFLKSAAKGTLQTEAQMTDWFHRRGMGARVLGYVSDERDWLLTERVRGEDCITAAYLAQPERLCDTVAQAVRLLHEQPADGCCVVLPEEYMAAARENHSCGKYHASHFPSRWGFETPEEAWDIIERDCCLLRTDTLIHGDCCLPNIMLDDWSFSGFIDLGASGAGDRHIDLFWAMWSLAYNLGTDRYSDRFLDAYGRESVDMERLRLVAAVEAFG